MTSRFLNALMWAAELHRLQRRKNAPEAVPGKCPRSIPYINHLIAVAELLASVGGVEDEDVLIAAVLHDAVEDTPATVDAIRERFGDRVASIVDEVSDDRSLSREERKRLQVEHAGQLSHEARLVKLADKIHNCADLRRYPPGKWTPERMDAYRAWSREVIAPIRGTHAALEDLFDTVSASNPSPSNEFTT